MILGWSFRFTPVQHMQTMATTSQQELKKLDAQVEDLQRQVEDLQAQRKALIAKRRSLVEAKCKGETPRDAFESRLAQLRLENPSWVLKGPDWEYCNDDDDDDEEEVSYYVRVANCPDAELDFLNDPDKRYRFCFDYYEQHVYFERGGCTATFCEGLLRVPKEKAAKKQKK